MKSTVYSVYDRTAKLYAAPFIEKNDGTAMRAITDVMRDPNHQFVQHCNDYALVKIAEYDDETGAISPIENAGVVVEMATLAPNDIE